MTDKLESRAREADVDVLFADTMTRFPITMERLAMTEKLEERLRRWGQWMLDDGSGNTACVGGRDGLAMVSAADAIQIMREALDFYSANHEWPNEGPWGVDSTDFGNVARAALDKVSKL
ncbi:hypothetical protein [Sphingomonas japonica]|uniref:Uncharacterized protein n=1 Tax=Sphingomonas japonica TaxID=511662 RepID=A0ABX0U2Q6_9SPHN|nr:hypothetical protein [Sphingomonas japonica]NIJ24854.1 hypothetical protein [Sphingomonas japonica]